MTSLLRILSSAARGFARTSTARLVKPPAALLLLLTMLSGIAHAQNRALILVGAPGSPMYQRHYDDRVKRFTAVLNKAGITQVTTIADKPAKDVLDAVKRQAGESKPDSQFVLIILGHGEASEAGVTLTVPGPDLQMAKLAEALKGVKSRSQVVLNFAASSGNALPLLAMPGRVNIASSSPTQVNDNDLAEFVLAELEKNPKQPLLAVYNAAVRNWAQWTVRQTRSEGGWTVEGKQSAAVSKKLYGGSDVSADRKYADSPNAAKPDPADPPLVPDGSDHWADRRLVTEHPSLDDSGQQPASALGEKGFAAVTPGKDQPQGKIAAKTVLGQP